MHLFSILWFCVVFNIIVAFFLFERNWYGSFFLCYIYLVSTILPMLEKIALCCFTLLTGITCVQTTASESGLFDHLINVWEFKPGPVPGTCDLYFLVDFKFQSPLYRQVASMFFKEVVSRLVGSFSDRCFRIYGPPVPVLENSYGQGRWICYKPNFEGCALRGSLEDSL